MNVLYGLYEPTEGEILVDDKPVTFRGPGDAMAAGIGMVHQHFMLVPVFTVAENVALGAETTKSAGFLDLDDTRRKIREISDRYGFDVDPDALIEDLPVGVQQRVEIIKALVRDAKVLILDEPTAVLTPQDTDELLDIMRQLKSHGTSIVFISHKLREVKAVSDTITVIRRGKVVGSADPGASTTELASMMVGRAVSLTLDKAPATPQETTFRGQGPDGHRAQRPARRGRSQLRDRPRRDPRHRGRPGQRPDGTHRGDPGPARAGPRLDRPRRRRTPGPQRQGRPQRRRRIRPGRPFPRRADRHVLDRREPDPGPLRPGRRSPRASA